MLPQTRTATQPPQKARAGRGPPPTCPVLQSSENAAGARKQPMSAPSTCLRAAGKRGDRRRLVGAAPASCCHSHQGQAVDQAPPGHAWTHSPWRGRHSENRAGRNRRLAAPPDGAGRRTKQPVPTCAQSIARGLVVVI